jgi:hypothetical protein
LSKHKGFYSQKSKQKDEDEDEDQPSKQLQKKTADGGLTSNLQLETKCPKFWAVNH